MAEKQCNICGIGYRGRKIKYCSDECAKLGKIALDKIRRQRPEVKEKESARLRNRKLDPAIRINDRLVAKVYGQKQERRAKQAEHMRRFKYLHPEKVQGFKNESSKRRWEQAAATADGSVTNAVISRLTIEKHCAYCLQSLNKDNRQFDHVAALSTGGTHTAANLVACCAQCNMSKGSKRLWLWLMDTQTILYISKA